MKIIFLTLLVWKVLQKLLSDKLVLKLDRKHPMEKKTKWHKMKTGCHVNWGQGIGTKASNLVFERHQSLAQERSKERRGLMKQEKTEGGKKEQETSVWLKNTLSMSDSLKNLDRPFWSIFQHRRRLFLMQSFHPHLWLLLLKHKLPGRGKNKTLHLWQSH